MKPLFLLSIFPLLLAEALGQEGLDPELPASDSAQKWNMGDWCEWLSDKPGKLDLDKENPWLQSFRIGGRFNYQAAWVQGNDVNGLSFDDNYQEFRRLRLESRTEFLQFFTAEVNWNLVDDTRFRRNTEGSVNFGEGPFDEISLEFDIEKALGLSFVDELKLKAGRMRLRLTHEGHTSSREIPTIERSSLESILGGEAQRPTGVLLNLEKGPWDVTFGAFNADENDNVISDWSEGVFYYGSIKLKASKNLDVILDYVHTDPSESFTSSGISNALGFERAGAISFVYEKKRWGASLIGAYGTNGEDDFQLLERRQGAFYGVVATPWIWLLKDRIQLVGQYQFLGSKESQGIQIRSRYLRGEHDNPFVDDDNGRGDIYHHIYGGLNLHPCEKNMRIMLGVSYENLATRNGGNLEALTYLVGFQTFF